ncbi:MAG: LysM peptidoglycan-binding domain-containing protein [Anaerolineae bacterium]|nr:LysM peptidoglycan-binding domain-containing protein [Anaerolineae bacterium]
MPSRFETAPMSRRDLILVIVSGVTALAVIIGLIIILTQAGREPKEPIGTAETTLTSVPPTTVSAAAPSPVGPPTETPSPVPTPTLEPYQYKVQPGDTLFAIIQLFGYRDISVVPEVIRLNEMANETDLQPDETLLIPRQTPTTGPTETLAPTLPPDVTPTATIEVTIGPTLDHKGCNFDNKCPSPDGKYWVHEVQEGDTIALLAYQYVSRVDAIMQANGSPEFIVPGQRIQIPILVTLTPTLTPTGGPDSTATPTPTLSPPSLLAPVDGETVPRGDAVILQWIARHPLSANQHYLVVAHIAGTDQEHKATTRSNSYRLPDSLRPGVGKSIQIEWQVVIVSGDKPSATSISGLGPTWTFTWGP